MSMARFTPRAPSLAVVAGVAVAVASGAWLAAYAKYRWNVRNWRRLRAERKRCREEGLPEPYAFYEQVRDYCWYTTWRSSYLGRIDSISSGARSYAHRVLGA